LTKNLEQVLVESLAIRKTGQRIGFAVVEQRDVMPEILDQTHQQHAPVGREFRRERNFDHIDRPLVGNDRENQAIRTAG